MQFFRSPALPWRLFRFSFVSLPYFYFAVFPGLIGVIGLLWGKFRQSALDRSTNRLLLVITGLMLLSCLFAADRGEALLQLNNFLPYMLLFTVLPYLLDRTEALAGLAMDVVIATIPINLVAAVEYVLRSPEIPRWLRRTQLSRWFRSRPHAERAMVMFGHPNALASYLVLVLGLGLGLILYQANRNVKPKRWQKLGLYVGVGSCLVGIFASGSRNGILVAISQLVVFGLLANPVKANLAKANLAKANPAKANPANQLNRWIWGLGAIGLTGLIAGVVRLGVGGRSLLEIDWANDPRVGVWRFGLNLLVQRPILGWGLGNFKLQYPPGLIPEYEYIAHPHNFWLLLAVEAGIPVMILFTVLVGRIYYGAIQQLFNPALPAADRSLTLAYVLAFWGCITFALFDVAFYDARINVMNWFLLAGLYSLVQGCRTRTHSTASAEPK